MNADNPRTSERERIAAVYRYYDVSEAEQRKRDTNNRGVRLNSSLRWAALLKALAALDLPVGFSVLDVGCGAGGDLQRIESAFEYLQPSLHGVDVLQDRIDLAAELIPRAELRVGSADRLPYADQTFDVIIAATVFSSILDDNISADVAREITRATSRTGSILCYDMRYPNPWNSHTRPITGKDLKRLFPAATMSLSPITLLPPLARRLGRTTNFAYRPLYSLPKLRSHYLATISPHTSSQPGSPTW